MSSHGGGGRLIRRDVLAAARLRARDAYEVVPFTALPASQQALLGDVVESGEYFGILQPRAGSGLAIKAVSHDLARLLTLLREPARGADTGVTATDTGEGELAQLVLDGVLEIEGDAGFVTGPDAAAVVLAAVDTATVTTATARLSLAALRYAEALCVDDALALSARLYFFNRQPVSPAWRRRLDSTDAVAAFLGLGRGEPTAARLEAAWRPFGSPNDPAQGWRRWRHPERGRGSEPATRYKLYVSPRCDALPDALRATIDVLTDSAATHVKVGSTEQGVLRPDKLVAYFPSRTTLEEAARELAPRLEGLAPHGTPFTADISGDGMLSWGTDLPGGPQVMWRQHESWRLWVTNRLAIALLAAKRAGATAIEPWRFALARLALDGVDPTTWTLGPAGRETGR